MLPIDTLLHQDCLTGMAALPDASIDCIITDLPYQVLHKSNKNVQWDRLIPFEPMWEQFNRIIKPHGAIVLFGQGMFTAQLMMSNPKMWRYNLIWDKKAVTGFLNANRQPMRCHEDIMIFSKSPTQYHPQFEVGEPNHPRGHGPHRNTNRCYGSHDNHDPAPASTTAGASAPTAVPDPSAKAAASVADPIPPDHQREPRYKTGSTYDYAHVRVVPPTKKPTVPDGSPSVSPDSNLKFPRSIIPIPKEKGRDIWHPTQKPVALIRWLIRTYTNPGDLILDACMGSGSTAIAAIDEGRHYIGYELNDDYWQRATDRIAQHVRKREPGDKQLTLEL